MADRDHNPHRRRLHLPIVSTNPSAAEERKPPWLKVRLQTGPNYQDLKGIMRGLSLHTVCEEAMCPNIHECWEEREATFLILGDKCTRRCGFCDVMTARPDPVDEDEPRRIAEAVTEMGLRFVVLTGVARDDLPDGGARIWAATVRAIRVEAPYLARSSTVAARWPMSPQRSARTAVASARHATPSSRAAATSTGLRIGGAYTRCRCPNATTTRRNAASTCRSRGSRTVPG